MKKIFAILLIVLIAFSFSAPSFAEGRKETWDKMGFTLTYPEEFSNTKGIVLPNPYPTVKDGIYSMLFNYYAFSKEESDAVLHRWVRVRQNNTFGIAEFFGISERKAHFVPGLFSALRKGRDTERESHHNNEYKSKDFFHVFRLRFFNNSHQNCRFFGLPSFERSSIGDFIIEYLL